MRVNCNFLFLIHDFSPGLCQINKRVPLVEQDLPTPPEHQSSPPDFSRLLVSRSLALQMLFVLFSFFFQPLSCLTFDLRIMITSLVSFIIQINKQGKCGMHWILKVVYIYSYISMKVGNNTHTIGKYQLKDGRGKNFSNQVLNIQHYDINIIVTSL